MLSSLGVGSGILSSNIIDQLRVNDEKVVTRASKAGIQKSEYQMKALDELDTLFKTLSDAMEGIKDKSLFGMAKASFQDEDFKGFSIEANTTESSSFTFEVTQLAQRDVKSITFNSEGEVGQKGNITINGEKIKYDATDTLRDIEAKIDAQSDITGVSATTLRVGDGTFELMLSSKETGYNGVMNVSANRFSIDDIQDGQDAIAKYNGITISSETNTFNPVEGIEIKAHMISSEKVTIEPDTEKITEMLEAFVGAYNAVQEKLTEFTKSSGSASERGIFNGDSSMRGMKSQMNNFRQELNLMGFETDRDGKISIMDGTIPESAEEIEAFVTQFDAMFDDIENITKYNGTMDMFQSSVEGRNKRFQENLEKQIERLDSKYAIMTKQFAAYDTMIGQMNSISGIFSQQSEG